MPIAQTIDTAFTKAVAVPRSLLRRPAAAKAAAELRMSTIEAIDPLAAIAGITPRYMRRATDIKAAVDAAAALALLIKPPPEALWYLREMAPRIDATTPGLRRRILEAVPEASAQMQSLRFALLSLAIILTSLLLLCLGRMVLQS